MLNVALPAGIPRRNRFSGGGRQAGTLNVR